MGGMADLIDRDTLLADIADTIENSGCVNHEREIMDCIRYAPAAHVCKPDEIAALRAENERLRAGLDTMRELLEGVTEKTVSMPGNVWYAATGALRIARAALEGGQHGTDQT